MAELTKDFFEEQLKSLATKSDLKPLTETLSRTSALVANLSESFKEHLGDTKSFQDILESHTTTLDKILKNTTDWNTEAAALRSAIKRHERMISQMAHKLGMNFENEQL